MTGRRGVNGTAGVTDTYRMNSLYAMDGRSVGCVPVVFWAPLGLVVAQRAQRVRRCAGGCAGACLAVPPARQDSR